VAPELVCDPLGAVEEVSAPAPVALGELMLELGCCELMLPEVLGLVAPLVAPLDVPALWATAMPPSARAPITPAIVTAFMRSLPDDKRLNATTLARGCSRFLIFARYGVAVRQVPQG
jgi:hypothetical protein